MCFLSFDNRRGNAAANQAKRTTCNMQCYKYIKELLHQVLIDVINCKAPVVLLPVQFGGGKDKAKPLFEKAVALFKAAQPKPLYPNWGKEQAEAQLALCN